MDIQLMIKMSKIFGGFWKMSQILGFYSKQA